MIAKSPVSASDWVDPDDAPELTDDFFEKAQPKIGDQPISPQQAKAAFAEARGRGRPRAAVTKIAKTFRYDAEVLQAFEATGKGWHARVNAALKDWLKTHDPKDLPGGR